MSAKAISEATGKRILNAALAKSPTFSPCQFVSVSEENVGTDLSIQNGWLSTSKLVVKPDQLIKRRGKLGLIKVNVDYPGVRTWLKDMMAKDIKVEF
jgi:ATP citrate (pro-S)-lyase